MDTNSNKMPVAVTIISIFFLLFGLLGILGVVGSIYSSVVNLSGGALSGSYIAVTLLNFAFFAVLFASSFALREGKRWALIALSIVLALQLLNTIGVSVFGSSSFGLSSVLKLIPYVMLGYLWVKQSLFS